MRPIETLATNRYDLVLVAWMDDRGQQVTFVASRTRDNQWMANGRIIATPTHWCELPRIDA